jgi:hypothetical protein
VNLQHYGGDREAIAERLYSDCTAIAVMPSEWRLYNDDSAADCTAIAQRLQNSCSAIAEQLRSEFEVIGM